MLRVTCCYFFLFFISTHLNAQNKTISGYTIHDFVDRGDSIKFYWYNPNQQNDLFVFLQGSSESPLSQAFYWFSDDKECCYSAILPKKVVKKIAEKYAVVFVSKPYIPTKINIDHFQFPKAHLERDYIDYQVSQTDRVIHHIFDKKLIEKSKKVLILGHSEGSDVSARVGSTNPHVTHLGMLSGDFYTPMFFDVIMAIRRKIQRKELTAQIGQIQIDSILQVMEKVVVNPKAKDKFWLGESYLWHENVMRGNLQYLLSTEKPIYVVTGTKDDNTVIESADILRMEFIKHQKTNLFFEPCYNCDHGLTEYDENDAPVKDHYYDYIFKFIRYTEQEH